MKNNKNSKSLNDLTLSYGDAFYAAFNGYEKDFENIKEFIGKCPDGPIVEMGSGFGRLLPLFEDSNVILVEQDDRMVSILRKLLNGRKNATIIKASATKIPLEDNSVAGLIFAANTLAEMKPLAFAIAESTRVLKPGGCIYISIQNPDFKGYATAYYRSVEQAGVNYTFHIDTVPTPIFGDFAYQTHMLVRNEKLENTFIVPQTFPNISYWNYLLNQLGLEIDSLHGSWFGHEFDTEKSFLINLVAKKNDAIKPNIYQPELKSIYERMASKYDIVIKDSRYSVPKWLEEEIVGWRGLQPNLLDLGCGNGWLPIFLRENGISAKSYGIDVSPAMIEVCRKKNVYEGLMVADLATTIPVAEEMFFDLIAAFGLFEFIPTPKESLAKIRKLLRSGGEALLSFEETVNQIHPSGTVIPELNAIKFHYTESMIRSLIESSGLKIQSLFKCSGYVSPTSHVEIPYVLVRVLRVD